MGGGPLLGPPISAAGDVGMLLSLLLLVVTATLLLLLLLLTPSKTTPF